MSMPKYCDGCRFTSGYIEPVSECAACYEGELYHNEKEYISSLVKKGENRVRELVIEGDWVLDTWQNLTFSDHFVALVPNGCQGLLCNAATQGVINADIEYYYDNEGAWLPVMKSNTQGSHDCLLMMVGDVYDRNFDAWTERVKKVFMALKENGHEFDMLDDTNILHGIESPILFEDLKDKKQARYYSIEDGVYSSSNNVIFKVNDLITHDLNSACELYIRNLQESSDDVKDQVNDLLEMKVFVAYEELFSVYSVSHKNDTVKDVANLVQREILKDTNRELYDWALDIVKKSYIRSNDWDLVEPIALLTTAFLTLEPNNNEFTMVSLTSDSELIETYPFLGSYASLISELQDRAFRAFIISSVAFFINYRMGVISSIDHLIDERNVKDINE